MATPAEWLEIFEQQAAQGVFDNEPDFETALGVFRAQVAAGDPRTLAWEWLCEMYERSREGKPGITEEEYSELKDWYMRNESTVYDGDIRNAFYQHLSTRPQEVRRHGHRGAATEAPRRERRLAVSPRSRPADPGA
jgi:hypothetical protein